MGPPASGSTASLPARSRIPACSRTTPAFIKDLEKKNPLNRIGKNHEIVGPTLFLLTESASYVTGHNLIVDGGWTIW